MDFKTMSVEELNERRKAIVDVDMIAEGADLDALESEMRSINAELEARKAAEAEKVAKRAAIVAGAGAVVEEPVVVEREKTMDAMEIRKSDAYVEAFANYIKTGKSDECRSLLSTNVEGGTVAVPVIVEDIIKTAWDNEPIMALVRKSALKGNVQIGFEISATGAVVHTEGTAAPAEQTLTLGIAELKAESIKKWVTVSDEAADLRGSAFLNYIYRELVHHIAKKAADILVGKIVALPTTATSTSPSADKVSAAPAMATVAGAMAHLSDEANNPVIIMNKLTYANFKTVQYANGYGADPFEGLRVLFNNTLPAYDSADASAVYMIVGDLGYGAQANFPNGEEVTVKMDDLSLAEKDLIKFVGREFVGIGVTAVKAFVNVTKPATI